MKLFPAQSVSSSLYATANSIYVQRHLFSGYKAGTNKADEYSWFYIVALSGQKDERVKLLANISESDIPSLTRDNSLLFYSADQINWHRINEPVLTDSAGLKQYCSFTLPISGRCYISNTIFFDYQYLRAYFAAFAARHTDLCRLTKIGSSLAGLPLDVLTLSASAQPRGRILVTTGCHPAEPDVIASQSILDWLVSPPGQLLLQQYDVDVLPLSNPDGYAQKSCLTANGINLYWNFLKDDQTNCPEAYFLWQYIRNNPPLLYLDFHSYVHQYHRHPMPYLKDPTAYHGAYPKNIVRQMDRFLIKQSNGYYRFGKLAMWPRSLSYYITREFNTIAYTKYHFNLYEGLLASQTRATNIFAGLSEILLRQSLSQEQILFPPHGSARADLTDRAPYLLWYQVRQVVRQVHMYLKSYYRYYRHRNKTNLYRTSRS